MKLIKIAHIITGLNVGGAEMMLLNMLKLYNGKKYAPLVISLTGPGVLLNEIKTMNVSLECFDFKKNNVVMEFIKLIYFLRFQKVEVIQTWLYHADFFGGIAGKLLGMPVVWGIHNSYLDKKGKKTTGWIRRLNAYMSAYIPKKMVSCSGFAADLHRGLGYKDVFTIIPNGFDVKKYYPDKDKRMAFRYKYNLENTIVLGFVARYDPLKDFENFISALGIFIAQCNCIKIVMCGRNVNCANENIMHLIKNKDLGDHIILLGERNDIDVIMNGIDFFVLSSKSEAFPMVLGEAMACGTPCITTDVGDAKDIIGETGVCVPKKDPMLLAQGILAAIHWESKLYEEKSYMARKRIVEYYSLDKVVNRYFDVYDEVMKK